MFVSVATQIRLNISAGAPDRFIDVDYRLPPQSLPSAADIIIDDGDDDDDDDGIYRICEEGFLGNASLGAKNCICR